MIGLVLAEPDVTLTDWALSAEAFVLARLVRSHGGAWVVFFASIGVAALLGGVSHGFFPGRGDALATAVWRATLLAIGVTAVAAVAAGSQALDARPAAGVRGVAVALGLVYGAVVLAGADAFAVAVVAYLPATLFLLGVFVASARRARSGAALVGAAGLVVLLAGSWVQWRAIEAPALGLTYNAVFHVIQMVALPLICRGASVGRAGKD